MDVLKLDLDVYSPLILPIIILILAGGIIGIVFKSQINNFEKYLAIFKFAFYILLAFGTFLLDVTVDGDSIKSIGFDIPDKLTIGQFLLIVLSTFEACSNFIDFLKVPKSDFHLVTKEKYQTDKIDDSSRRIQTAKKIAELEEEIADIKRSTLCINKSVKENEEKENMKSKDVTQIQTRLLIIYFIQEYIVGKIRSKKK